MATVNDHHNPWAGLFEEYCATALLDNRDTAFRRRTQIVRQARQLLGRRHRTQAWWLFEALEDPARMEFITSVLAPNVPRYVIPAMIRAGVHEPNLLTKRRFIEPCVRSYGHRWINELLVRYLAEGTSDERIGAATALYWATIREEFFWLTGFVIGARDFAPTQDAQAQYAVWQPVRDRRTALLVDVFRTTGDRDARRYIVSQLFLDPWVPDTALRTLGRPALDLAAQSDNRHIQWRATRLQHGIASERATSEAALGTVPYFRDTLQAYRVFLHRCVRFLSDQGITQFLDLDSSLFPYDTVHAAVQGTHPTARIVYVRSDPVRAASIRALVQNQPGLAVVQADVLDPQAVLAHGEVQRQLDFTRPLAILLLSALWFLRDDAQARHVVQQYRDAVPAGSYLVLGHGTRWLARESKAGTGRSQEEMAAFFAGMALIEPGIVYTPQWRPEAENGQAVGPPARDAMVCGVGRKL